MFHLTTRVAWHDFRWDGSICRAPSCNSFCTALDRIREEKDDDAEDALAATPWNELPLEQLPPCQAESGAFMNATEWTRRFVHPYAGIEKAMETHGHLKPTLVKVPSFATFAVPFAWMLRSGQKAIDEKLPTPLPPDEKSPFNSAWVFGRARQEALLNLFSRRLSPGRSLVFFYCKEGQPLGDTIPRLVTGVGRITNLNRPNAFDVRDTTKPTHLMWDLLFRHSIRPNGHDGFLLPYHEYIEATGDPSEDARRMELLREIAVPADPAHMRVFSNAAELAPADIALSTLVRCLGAVRKIREHRCRRRPVGASRGMAKRADRASLAGPRSISRSWACARGPRHATRNCTDVGLAFVGNCWVQRRSMADHRLHDTRRPNPAAGCICR